jgi:hypothetical protein
LLLRRRELVERNKELIRKGLLIDYGRRDGMVVLVATKYLTYDGLFMGYEPNSLKSKKIYTHDFRGNEPEGQYWAWIEESFEHSATEFRAAGNDRAAAIADQLVATADNVPAELMSEYQEFWTLLGIVGNAVFFDPRLVKGVGVHLAFVGSQRGPGRSAIFGG